MKKTWRVLSIMLPFVLPTWTSLQAGEPDFTGRWLSFQRDSGGLGTTLELSPDGRIRIIFGIERAWQWRLQECKEDRCIVHYTDPSGYEEDWSAELRIVPGKKTWLVQKDLFTAEVKRLEFVTRGNQLDEPPFLGLWQAWIDIEGRGLLTRGHQRRALFEFTDDGWLWIRVPFNVAEGTYEIVRNHMLIDWGGIDPPITDIRILNDSLVVVFPKSGTAEFVRPREVLP